MTEINEQTSDGYHTFGELYNHRRALTVALCLMLRSMSWRSKEHHPDGDPMFDGHFIVGISFPGGTITYHFRLEHWDEFTGIRELKHAKKWDGATPDDTIVNLKKLSRILRAID